MSKELGRLATWLRILGFDAEYFRRDELSSLIIEALRDDRIILTRNRHLSNRTSLKIVFVDSETIKEQLREVLKALNIRLNKDIMFSRCTICNDLLLSAEKAQVKDRVPEYVFTSHDKFLVCPKCGRIYWQGTHWGNVAKLIDEITKSPDNK